MPTSTAVRRLLGLCGTVLAVACGDPPAVQDDGPAAAGPPPTVLPDTGRIYERSLVFLGTETDSVFTVPWFLSARTGGETTLRRGRAWILRGSVWDPFYDLTWRTDPVRAPWRPLPYGPLRVFVGPEGALERLAFEENGRRLDLALDSSLAQWTGRRGETFRFLSGGVVLAERRVAGLVLDLNRARDAAEGPGGDWAVLASGDSLQVVLHAPTAADTRMPEGWRGWARVDFRDLPLVGLSLEWTTVRPFDRARRDVPVGWTIRSADGTVGGTLDARSSHLVAGEGEGPILPVDGLFDVVGTLILDGGEYPVHGLLRHTQGA